MIKRWFNRRFPYYQLCGRRWCLQPMTYQYRCHLHQDDNRDPVSVHPLAGWCEHRVGWLDHCKTCDPVPAGTDRKADEA